MLEAGGRRGYCVRTVDPVLKNTGRILRIAFFILSLDLMDRDM